MVAEAGAMNWMEEGITLEARMGEGCAQNESIFGKLLNVGKSLLTGESIFMTHFTNEGQGKKLVASGAPCPCKIIALDMSTIGGKILCQKDAFLCAALGTEVSIHSAAR